MKIKLAITLFLVASVAQAATYTEDTSFIGPNPERGVYSKNGADFNSGTSPTSHANTMYGSRSFPTSWTTTNSRATIYYSRFVIPCGGMGSSETTFQNNLAALRGTGMKAALRVERPSAGCTMSQDRTDIIRLGQLIAPYCDVIAYMEAGFIGSDGEWHGTCASTTSDCVCEAKGVYFPRDSPTDPCRTTWPAGCDCPSTCVNNFCTNTRANTVACSVDTDCIGADTQNIFDAMLANWCPTGPLQRMVGFRNPRFRMIPKYFQMPTAAQAYDGSDLSRQFAYIDGWFTGRYAGAGSFNCMESEGVGGGGEADQWLEDKTEFTFATGESSQYPEGTCSTITSCTTSSCAMCPDSGGWECAPAGQSVGPACTSSQGTCQSYRAASRSIPSAAANHLSSWNDGFSVPGTGCTWQSETGGAGGFTASCETAYVLDNDTYSGGNALAFFLKRLGYRYILESASWPASCASGGSCSLTWSLRNDGFARLYNKRTAYVTLDNGTTRRNIPLTADFRKLYGPGGTGAGTPVSRTETFTVPTGIPNGTYTIALWLPDEAATLRSPAISLANEVKYSIRFANSGTWDSGNGYNELGTITIGSVDQCNADADCPDDAEVCTTKVCNNPASSSSTCGQVANSLSCTDGVFCNGTDTCSASTCSVHSGNPCASGTTCQEATDNCATNPGCTTDADCRESPTDNPCTTDVCVPGSSGFPTLTGRIAISSDGNKNDCDDIGASAVSVGLLGASGNAAKLVYYGHSDHHWSSGGTCGAISGGAAREAAMDDSTHDIAQTWNAYITSDFDLSVFHECAQAESGNVCTGDCATCVTALTAAINASSATDPLYIIGAGPMDIIGRAMNAATSTKRQFVTLISHSSWNDDHSDVGTDGTHSGWTWDNCGTGCTSPFMTTSFTNATFRHTGDQNGELNQPLSTWSVWNTTSNPKMKAIYDRIVASNKAGDISDAGMTLWLVLGFPTDNTPTATQMKNAFTTAPASEATCSRTNNTLTCTDGLFCNGNDACFGGTCSAHAGNPCSGGAVCSEGTDTCDVDACNTNAECQESPTDNPCTTNTCVNPSTSTSTCSTSNNLLACTDGTFCNGADTCGGGTCSTHAGDPCTATGKTCNELTDTCDLDECDTSAECHEFPSDNICTTDTCNNASASNSTCSHTNNTAACSDGIFCNGTDTCLTGTCQVHAGNACPTNYDCQEATDTCTPTTPDECDSNSDCAESPTDEICTTDTCNNAATETSTCSRANNTLDCTAQDGLRCNGTDTCSGGTCATHSGNPCGDDEDVSACIEDWSVPNPCHTADISRMDYPNVVTVCTSTPSQTTTFAVDIRAERDGVTESSSVMDRRVLLVMFATHSRDGDCNTATPADPVVTVDGTAATKVVYLQRSETSAGNRGFCWGSYYLEDPPLGTSDVVISWNSVQETVVATAIPLYHADVVRAGGNIVPEVMTFPKDDNYSSTFPNRLMFRMIATALRGTHTDEEETGTNITDPTRLWSESCGSPGFAASMQFNEEPFATTPDPVEWGFDFDNSPSEGIITSVEVYDGQVTTTTSTTTTLFDYPGAVRCVAKCLAKLE